MCNGISRNIIGGKITWASFTSFISTFYNEITYTGAIYGDSTGLYHMSARYYDPDTGRFLSQDAYRGEAKDSGTWNLYVYCASNPINYVDPRGHWPQWLTNVVNVGIGAVAIGVGVVATALTACSATPVLLASIKIALQILL